jgi:hypothetical protein
MTLMLGATALALPGPGGQFGLNGVVCAGATAARLRASRFCVSLAPMLAADTERGCVLRVLRRSLPRTDSAEVHAMHACYLRAVLLFCRSASGRSVAQDCTTFWAVSACCCTHGESVACTA